MSEKGYFADATISVRVWFNDNGGDALIDQAYETLRDAVDLTGRDGVIEIGEINVRTPSTTGGA